jgi:hypothetical protein
MAKYCQLYITLNYRVYFNHALGEHVGGRYRDLFYGIYEGKSKSKGTLKKKLIYCKYTETKPMSLFNVIPPRLQRTGPRVSEVFLIPPENSFLVASFTNFALRQFLKRIVTADETWVHHYEPESKAQSMAWKRPTSPVAKKFKSQLSACKIMLTVFWEMEVRFWFTSLQRVKSLTVRFPYVWPNERSSKRKKVFFR